MAINTFKKNNTLYRNSKMHYLNATGESVSTAEFTAGASTAPFNAAPTRVIDNPISHIKALGDEYNQDAVSDAFYAGRVAVWVGTLDEAIVGHGWTAEGDGWRILLYLDEGDIVDGPFDYVECQTSAQNEAIMAYEIIK